MRKQVSYIYVLLFIALLVTGCRKDKLSTTENPPEIIAMSPLSGPKGTIVTLTGINFSNDITVVGVYVNGKYADVIESNLTTIKFIVPPRAGTGLILVSVNGNAGTGPFFEFIYTINVSTLTGFSAQPGLIDGNPQTARFHAPAGIAIDQYDNLYIADELNHCIRKVTPSGNVSTFAGTGIAGHQDGTSNAARFNAPSDITFDKYNGNFYVADKGNHCIRKINFAGDVFTVAGLPGTAGYVDAPGLSARLQSPSGVAVEGEQPNLYIADQGNHCIRKLDDVGVMTTFAGSSSPGSQNGVGGAAKFSSPADITWDSTGFLYVTDITNHNIRRISKTTKEVFTAGGTGVPGYQDGSPSASSFNSPAGIISENNQSIICDVMNSSIRLILYNDEVSTLAGDGNAGFLNGSGAASKFNQPAGIVKDKNGDYFITEKGNNAVRKMTIY